MTDETLGQNDPQQAPEQVPPPFETAAVDRARKALRDADETLSAVPEAITGAIIGRRYKLLELIGEGGHGRRLDGRAAFPDQAARRHQTDQGGHGFRSRRCAL